MQPLNLPNIVATRLSSPVTDPHLWARLLLPRIHDSDVWRIASMKGLMLTAFLTINQDIGDLRFG